MPEKDLIKAIMKYLKTVPGFGIQSISWKATCPSALDAETRKVGTLNYALLQQRYDVSGFEIMDAPPLIG